MFVRSKTAAAFAALVIVLSSGVAFAGAFAANTQRALNTARVPAPLVHPIPSPSPSALPKVVFGPTGRPLPPLPPMPSGSSHFRRIKSATGACIAITGVNAGCAEVANAEEVFATGSNITWEAEDLIGSPHQDYYAPPATGNLSTTANLVAEGTAYATANGTARTITLATTGIYTFATLNTTTNTWDAIAYVLVGAAPNVETFTDGTLSTKTQTYTTNATGGGVTVYIGATVLNTTDTYMVGIEDQLTGQCVDTAPASTQPAYSAGNYHLCNLSTSAGAGAIPNNNGLILANWAVQLGTSPLPPEGGTYIATIYDQTTSTMVATRQFTIVDGRASAGTGRIWLQGIMNGNEAAAPPYYVSFAGPYPSSGCGTVANDETGPAAAYSSTRIAWNGTQTNVHDTDYTGIILCIGASGLASTTDTYEVVVTDPSGTPAYEFSIGAQPASNGLCGAAVGICIPPQYVEWSVPSQTSLPFEQAYSGSTWTATVYDKTLGKEVAQQSFQFLGYTTSWAFTSPAESTTLDIPTGQTSQTTSLLLTNTSDLTFGSNNGDSVTGFYAVWVNPAIKSLSIQGPSQASPCTVTIGTTGSCSATYSDSAGNSWNVFVLEIGSSDFFIEVTDTGGVPLKPGQTITISGLTVTTPTATTCTGSACELVTTAVPAHLIDAGQESTGGQVSNAFFIVNGSGTDSATATVGLAGYYNSSGTWEPIAAGGYTGFGYTPRCGITSADCTTAGQSHAILSLNQPFTGAISKVVLEYSLTNTSTSDQIQEFDIVPPAAFSVTSASVDTHGAGWTLNPQGAGNCGSATVSAICIKPTTNLAAGATGNYYIALTPPSSSFSYADLIGTIIYTQTGTQLSIPITPTTTSIATFIGSPTTIDSTAIGAYSFNGGLMTAGVTPSSVGTSTMNSLNFNLRNTTSGADPFPDEVDMVAVQFPSQTYLSVPTSCTNITTITTGWSCEYVNVSAGVTTFYFGQCPQSVVNPVPVVPTSSTTFGTDDLSVCPFSLPNEPYSLTAGATFSATIPVTAGSSTTSSPVTVASFGHGATTDAWSTPINTQISVVNTPAAGAGFSSLTVPGGTLSAATTGNEPTITGDYQGSSPSYYDTYVYTVKNTGSTNITAVNITIPSSDTTGSNGADPSGTIWNVTGASVIINPVGTANGCTVGTIVNPASGTGATGTLPITCPSGDFPAGDTMQVTFTAKSPLKINATYAFPATIQNGATAGAVAPNWTDDEDILIALSATLTVNVNPSMTCGGTATPGTGYPVATPATETVNFGAVASTKYEYCKDAMIVQVTTDASTPTNWSLYASAGANPAATAGNASATGTATTESTSNELLVSMDPASSTGGTANVPAANIPCSTTSCFTYDNTTYAAMALTSSGTGTRLGYTTNGGTNVNNATVNFYVNYQVAVGTETVPPTGEQETITYTWIAN